MLIEIPLMEIDESVINDVKVRIDKNIKRARIKACIKNKNVDILMEYSGPKIKLGTGIVLRLIGKELLRSIPFEFNITSHVCGVNIQGCIQDKKVNESLGWNTVEIGYTILKLISEEE